jgi:hypothetical protein
MTKKEIASMVVLSRKMTLMFSEIYHLLVIYIDIKYKDNM